MANLRAATSVVAKGERGDEDAVDWSSDRFPDLLPHLETQVHALLVSVVAQWRILGTATAPFSPPQCDRCGGPCLNTRTFLVPAYCHTLILSFFSFGLNIATSTNGDKIDPIQ